MSKIDAIDWNSQIKGRGETPAIIAVKHRNVEILKILSEVKKIDWNILNDLGN